MGGASDGETEARKRGGRYSHVINVKWWQSVGGGGESGFTAHYRRSASCWGEEGEDGGVRRRVTPGPCQTPATI